jgi:AcrR family transcriptional regulator
VVQARVRRNDARILQAAVDVLASQGWAGLSLAAVGKTAGLSIRPVRDRFAIRGALAAGVWQERAWPALLDAFTQALRGAGLADASEALVADATVHRESDHTQADEQTFFAAMDAFARPNAELKAAAELAIIAEFQPELRSAVQQTATPLLHFWVDPNVAGGPTRAAKRAYLLALALGLLAASHRPSATTIDLHPFWRRLLRVIGLDRDPVALPTEPRPPHLQFIPFATGDAITDDLLRTTIDHLGEFGFEGAALGALADAAGYSEGAIFSRYPSKEALFVDAINRHQDIAFAGFREYLAQLEQTYGAGIAEAVAIRDAMRPEERRLGVIDMERGRMAWHSPALLQAEEERLQALATQVLVEDPEHPDFSDAAHLHAARAAGLGISFLPLLVGNAWDLPYDVITIPLAERARP